MEKKKWYERVPNAHVLLFSIIVIFTILTYIVPAGQFERAEVDGRMRVVAGTFHYVDQTPVGIIDMFKAIPRGMIGAADIVFITFFAGALFNVIGSTGALEAGIARAVSRFNKSKKSGTLVIWIMTFVFGLLGAVVGFENNIAIVPIGVMISLAMGYDLMVGAAMAIGGIGLGFATSPINPYSIGVAHAIAELPIFSGFGMRSLFCASTLAVLAYNISRYAKKIEEDPDKSVVKDIGKEGLNLSEDIEKYVLTGTHKMVILMLIAMLGVIIFGTVKFKWYLLEISTVFIVSAILIGAVARYSPDEIVNAMMQGAASVTSGAMIIGVARGISIVLDQGNISDTIINTLATPLQYMPTMISGVLMGIVHAIINFFIPSGSGQAMATMPIMVPLSDLIGLTRQTAVHAFQIGDGITNLIIPTLGGLHAMLAVTRIPFDRWFRFVLPTVIQTFLVGSIFTVIAILIHWGPF